MVGIPVHGTRNVKHELGNEEKQSTNGIANILGGLVVTGVESVNHIVLCAIACIEVMRTYGVCFQTENPSEIRNRNAKNGKRKKAYGFTLANASKTCYTIKASSAPL